MSLGLGIAVAGVAMAAALVAAAWIVSRSFTGQPVLPQREPAPPNDEELLEVDHIDTAGFTQAEMDEVAWVREILSKGSAPAADVIEAKRLLAYYQRHAERRAQEP